MKEELIKDSNHKMLVISAGAAVLVHALVFIGWTRIGLEQNAYAIGNHGNVEMILSAMESAPAPVQSQPQEVQPVVPPELVKALSEFKKLDVKKPVEKKVVKQTPVQTTEKPTATSPANANQELANKVAGDERGGATNGTSIAEPDYLNNPPPKYPNESRRKHEEGMVVILASINSGGRVNTLKISKGSGFERLDEAATAAVRDWKFKPARFAGIAIDSNVEIPVRFSLR